MRFALLAAVCAFIGCLALSPSAAQAPASQTKLIVLGTGTPNADPERWGPAVAIVVDNQSYLVDAGVGVVRRAADAAARHQLMPLAARNLRRVFITHLHSDHTLGLPDLMLSPWVLERPAPLDVYGPTGLAEMATHIEAAYRADIDMRLYGLEPQSTRNYRALVHEIAAPGQVYEDAHVKVDAFAVPHGSWPEAWGYRFRTADRTIVVSGDTRSSETVVEACNGCDVLVHEVYSAETFKTRPPAWQTYHASSHTSTTELAALAIKARPKLLVLYHQLFWGTSDEDLVKEVRHGYKGAVVSARDLDVFPPAEPQRKKK
jgi:ribonuclease BN (tRNA processing enzyme)